LAPRFGLDDGSSSDFDATLVLATMLVSQLNDGNVPQQPQNSARHAEEPRAAAAAGAPSPAPENFSNHTRVWSELSGVYLFGKGFLLAIDMVTVQACIPVLDYAPLWYDENLDTATFVRSISDHSAWTSTCLGVIVTYW
jgi:hypothetical protein